MFGICSFETENLEQQKGWVRRVPVWYPERERIKETSGELKFRQGSSGLVGEETECPGTEYLSLGDQLLTRGEGLKVVTTIRQLDFWSGELDNSHFLRWSHSGTFGHVIAVG